MKRLNILLTILILLTGCSNAETNTTTLNEPKIINIEFVEDLYPAYPVDYELDILLNKDENIILSSSDESIATIENNKVITKAPGTVTISASTDNEAKTQEITVTDLYTLEDTSQDKPFLKETICTVEQAHMLDDVLERKINEAGYQTRAGVVAAARFLSLQFPYKITYMSESGRLDTYINSHITDGEGRYYHKGLFLSEDKFDILGNGYYGRATWGQYFEEDDSDDHSRDEEYLSGLLTVSDIGTHLYLSKRPNGLDCSGFIAWCYLNGGFDFGDMGAGGPGTYGMSELGEFVNISDELLQSDRIKAGDLCGFVGHVGIVIGVEDDYIWIADTLITGLKVTRYERNVESFNQLGENSFKYFMLMDSEYLEDGNYTKMW